MREPVRQDLSYGQNAHDSERSFRYLSAKCQAYAFCNKAIWRCARVEEDTVCLSSNSERHQSAKDMLRKRALKGLPPFHQRCCDAEFLGAQACSLCDALIRKQAVKKVISQDRNGD